MNTLAEALPQSTDSCNYESFLTLICCFLVLSFVFHRPKRMMKRKFSNYYKKSKDDLILELENFSSCRRLRFNSSDYVAHLYEEWEPMYNKNVAKLYGLYIILSLLICLYTAVVTFFHSSHWCGYWNALAISPIIVALAGIFLIHRFNISKLRKKVSKYQDCFETWSIAEDLKRAVGDSNESKKLLKNLLKEAEEGK